MDFPKRASGKQWKTEKNEVESFAFCSFLAQSNSVMKRDRLVLFGRWWMFDSCRMTTVDKRSPVSSLIFGLPKSPYCENLNFRRVCSGSEYHLSKSCVCPELFKTVI